MFCHFHVDPFFFLDSWPFDFIDMLLLYVILSIIVIIKFYYSSICINFERTELQYFSSIEIPNSSYEDEDDLNRAM